MVGKPISNKSRSNKSSNLANGKIIKSPKKPRTNPFRSGSTAKAVHKKKSRKSEESDIAIVPSSSHESDNSDDDVKFIDEVEVVIEGKSKKRETNGLKSKGLDKKKTIGTLYSELKPAEKKEQKGEGKKEEKKTSSAMKKRGNDEGSKKEDNKLKGKEVKVKSPEKSKKGNGSGKQMEGKKDDKKKVVKEKECTDKRLNGTVSAEEKTDTRKKKVEGEKEKTGKRKNEDENTKENSKKRRTTEVEEAKKQKNGMVKVESKKEDKKVKNMKKNKEEEIEEENNALYHFPMSQVTRMIKSDDLKSKVAHEAVFVINKAAEKFLELFCREAYASAFLDQENLVAYNHLASVVSKRRRFDFLSDFVPLKVKAEEALAEMEESDETT